MTQRTVLKHVLVVCHLSFTEESSLTATFTASQKAEKNPHQTPFKSLQYRPRVQRCTYVKHKRVCAFFFLDRMTSNCGATGLSDRKRSESLQLPSPQVSTGLRMRENGAKQRQVLVLDGTYGLPGKEREER